MSHITNTLSSIFYACSCGNSQCSGCGTATSAAGSGAYIPSMLGQWVGNTTIHSGVWSPQLSPEEQKELETLEAEYQINLKAAKLAEFKKLPKELRQWVIDYITWQKVFSQVDQASVQKTQRQIDLENKKNNGYLSIKGNPWAQQGYVFNLPMPAGLSNEDIEQAHLEASLEEQIIDSE